MEGRWFLEGVAADGSRISYDVATLPFRVGRDLDNELMVPALGLSRRHAEITADVTGRLRVADLDSTNGTFVNRERINGSCLLSENDIVHFGNAEFRLGLRRGEANSSVDSERTLKVASGSVLSGHFVPHERQFLELLRGQGLSGALQPIVDARTRAPYAYELLGRSVHPDLPTSPIRLFNLAALLDREAELSTAFRDYGLRTVATRLAGSTLFVNTHPKETFSDSFLAGLQKLSAGHTPLNVVVELHETAVMEVSRMRELAARLKEIGVRFAYDDFGAGQARLNELAEVPAHFVKFDMGLVRSIDSASERKRKVVSDLVRLVHDLGSTALAEGVETEAEATICLEMGFELLQGYLTGRPVPLDKTETVGA
jgi:EAL domain-containing protein (putative c-di-GMP-specific phosphodiesterase class I)